MKGTAGYKVRTITCALCGKVDTRHRKAGQKFCSLECYRKAPKPYRRTGTTGRCVECGKEIYIRNSRAGSMRYCSMKCFNKAKSKTKTHTCKVCGRMFVRHRRGKNRPLKYCSIKCRTLCPTWKRNAVIAGNLAQQNTKKPSSLETAGNAILDALGIVYQTQVLICDKFTVDVFVPSRNLVIQWDGDYWHGYNSAKDERQKRRKRLDKSQDAYMRKAGYKVIRFWEHEVKKEAEKVSENLRTAIQ